MEKDITQRLYDFPPQQVGRSTVEKRHPKLESRRHWLVQSPARVKFLIGVSWRISCQWTAELLDQPPSAKQIECCRSFRRLSMGHENMLKRVSPQRLQNQTLKIVMFLSIKFKPIFTLFSVFFIFLAENASISYWPKSIQMISASEIYFWQCFFNIFWSRQLLRLRRPELVSPRHGRIDAARHLNGGRRATKMPTSRTSCDMAIQISTGMYRHVWTNVY